MYVNLLIDGDVVAQIATKSHICGLYFTCVRLSVRMFVCCGNFFRAKSRKRLGFDGPQPLLQLDTNWMSFLKLSLYQFHGLCHFKVIVQLSDFNVKISNKATGCADLGTLTCTPRRGPAAPGVRNLGRKLPKRHGKAWKILKKPFISKNG